ncbi:MAG: hypothetical protein SFU99_15995 [Saprospiraceae bacterium]|nr:hypothetical protein [Saprospiraceae bacterium]
MKAQSARNFNFGFKLSETELRKLVSLCKDQINKSFTEIPHRETYKVAFANGTIVENLELEEVLELENHGNGKIINMDIEFVKVSNEDEPQKEKAYLGISFKDKTHEFYKQAYPITTKIEGESRDWVFITSSLIQERIEKIKRKSFGLQIFSLPDWRIVGLMIITLVSLLLGSFYYEYKDGKLKVKYLEEKEKIDRKTEINKELSKSNRVKLDYSLMDDNLRDKIYQEKLDSLKNVPNINIIDAIAGVEQAKEIAERVVEEKWRNYSDSIDRVNESLQKAIKFEEIDSSRFKYLSQQYEDNYRAIIAPRTRGLVFLFFITPLATYIFIRILIYFYPLYNFIWGDYSNVFERKNKSLKYFLYSVLGGLILSILANKISLFF